MAEYAPSAIEWLGARIVAACGGEVSGIIGDASHAYGYHRARNVLPATDYSVQLPADRLGDGWAASALDVTLPRDMMPVVTRRLLDSARDHNDPRLDPVREFYGTLDHTSVTGWDCVAYEPATSDRSHTWHVHISILRQYANDMDAMRQILSVVMGESNSTGGLMADASEIIKAWAVGVDHTSDGGLVAPVVWQGRFETWQKAVDEKLQVLANRPAGTLTDAQINAVAQAVVKQVLALLQKQD